MTLYEQELSELKPFDQVQCTHKVNGWDFIITAGHGYLVVPHDNEEYSKLAMAINSYGFVGNSAVYLEEDCEAPAFLKRIGVLH